MKITIEIEYQESSMARNITAHDVKLAMQKFVPHKIIYVTEAAQHSVQATVAAPWDCPSCSHENHAMAIKCYFCDATAPNA